MNIHNNIILDKRDSEKLLAVLIDPEKIKIDKILGFTRNINQFLARYVFVGGGTDKES